MPRQWKLQHQLAAQTLASGLTADAAAVESMVSVRTVENWKTDPDFQALVQQYRDEIAARKLDAIVTVAIADRDHRVANLDRRWTQIRLIAERLIDQLAGGEAFDGGGAFGAKLSRKDCLDKLIAIVRLETGLQEEAAKEFGQRIDKLTLANLPDEALARVLQSMNIAGQIPDDLDMVKLAEGESE